MISNKNILDLEQRRSIYNYILKNPGLHQRELSRRLKIPKSTLLHHLKILKKQDLVILRTVNGYHRIYASKKLGNKEKEILNLLRQKIPQQILLYLVSKTHCSQIELSEVLEKKPPIISYYLKKLYDLDLIESVQGKNGKIRS